MGITFRRVAVALSTVTLAATATVAVMVALPDGTGPSRAAMNSTVPTAPPAASRDTSPASPESKPVTIPALPAATAGAVPGTRTPSSVGGGAAGSGAPAAGRADDRGMTATGPAPSTASAPPQPATTTPLGPPTPAARTAADPGTHAARTARPPAPARPPTTPATTRPAPTSTAKPPATTRNPATTGTSAARTATRAAAKPTPATPNFGVPVTLGNATQLITVAAPSRTSTSGTLRAWQKRADGTWHVVFGPVRANLGTAGIGPASENYSRTPLGTFTLTQAFGRLANPGTALPYHVTHPDDWWVSDTRAPTYNTMQTCAKGSCPFRTSVSERLYYITPYYDYAVVMDVNRNPVVPGGGSAFFLHVSVGQPTQGCIAIDRATLVKIMRWLDPAAHPRIATGIG